MPAQAGKEDVMIPTVTAGLAVVFFVLYLVRRRARLHREQ